MKIVVAADSHKEYKKYRSVVEDNLDADMFIHLGDGEHEFADVKREFPDKTFYFVQGESDFGKYEHKLILEAEGYRMLCVHGHEQNVGQGLDPLIAEAKAEDCKIALYGHTHMYRVDCIGGVYVMNPGAIDSPRGRNKPSYGVILIDDGGKIKMNLVAIKKSY